MATRGHAETRGRSSAVQEVGSHQQLQSNLGGNRKLWDLCGTVGVANLEERFRYDNLVRGWAAVNCSAHLISEVHADLLQHMRGNLTEVDFVGLVLRELARTREHSLDGSTGQSVLSLHNELVAVTGDELDKPGGNIQ